MSYLIIKTDRTGSDELEHFQEYQEAEWALEVYKLADPFSNYRIKEVS